MCIRDSSYIGYTATPFANIFIPPHIDDEKYGTDLFPRDFIYRSPRADQYIGAREFLSLIHIFIDQETWELVQKLRKTPRRKDTLGEANPLTGLVFCADCGAKMYNHRFQGDLENGNYPYDAYECSAYKLASRNRMDVCCSQYISTKAIRTLLLETIQAASTYARCV